MIPNATPLVPARLVETRIGPRETTIDGNFQGDGRLTGGDTYRFTVTGRGGVPGTDVSAAVLNVTAVNVTGRGFFTVFPCNEPPLASNEVIAKLSSTGEVCIYTLVDSDLVVDVDGYIPTTNP